MIQIIANCTFSGTHSPKAGVTLDSAKLASTATDGLNEALFAVTNGGVAIDLAGIKADLRGQIAPGTLYKVTIEPYVAPSTAS